MSNTTVKKTAAQAAAEAEEAARAAAAAADIADSAAARAQAAQTEQADPATQEALAIEAENAAIEAQAAADRAAAAAQEALQARSAQEAAAQAAAQAARDASASRAARAAAAAQEAGKARGAAAARQEQEAAAARAAAAAQAAQEAAARAIKETQELAARADAAVRAADERAAQAALSAKLAQEEEEREAILAAQAVRFSESEYAAQAADTAHSSKAAQAARTAQDAADRAALAALAARAAKANRAVKAAKETAVAREAQAAKAGQAAHAAHTAAVQAVQAARIAAAEAAAREVEADRAAAAVKSVHAAQENAENAAAERAMRAAEAAQKAQTAQALQTIQADHASRADQVFDATQSARDAQYCAARAAEASAERAALAVQADRASRADKSNPALKDYAGRVDKEAQKTVELAAQVDHAAQEAQDAVLRAANAALLSDAEQAARDAATAADRAKQIVSGIVPANTLQLPSKTAPAHVTPYSQAAQTATPGEQVVFGHPAFLSASRQPVPVGVYDQTGNAGSPYASGVSPAYGQSGQSAYGQPAPAGTYRQPSQPAYGQSVQPSLTQPAPSTSANPYASAPVNAQARFVQPGAPVPPLQAGELPALGNESLVTDFEFPNPYGQQAQPVSVAAQSGQSVQPKSAQTGQTLYAKPEFQTVKPGYPAIADEDNVGTRSISTNAVQAGGDPGSSSGSVSAPSGLIPLHGKDTTETADTSTAPGVSTSPLKSILNLDPEANARREKIAETEAIKAGRTGRYAHISVSRPSAVSGATADAAVSQENNEAAGSAADADSGQGGSESAIRAAALVARDAANRTVSRAQLRQIVNVRQDGDDQSGQPAKVPAPGDTQNDSKVRDAQITLPPGVTKSSVIANTASAASVLAPTSILFGSSTNPDGKDTSAADSAKSPAATDSTATDTAQPATSASTAAANAPQQVATTVQPVSIAASLPLTIAERIRAKQAAAAAAKKSGTPLPADVPVTNTTASPESKDGTATPAVSGAADNANSSTTVAPPSPVKAGEGTAGAQMLQSTSAVKDDIAASSVKAPAPGSPAARLRSLGVSPDALPTTTSSSTTTHSSKSSAPSADGKGTTTTSTTTTATEKIIVLPSTTTAPAPQTTKEKIAAASRARKGREEDEDDDDDEITPSRPNLNATAGLIPEEKKKSRLGCVLLLLLLLLAALLGWYLLVVARNEPSTYLSAPLKTGILKSTVKTTGTVKPVKEVNVGSEIPGIVLEVYVDSNDRVKKGDKLAKIDTTKIQQQIEAASASLNNAKAKENEANATFIETQSKLNRNKDLHNRSGGKSPSKLELDRVQADFDRAVAAKAAAAEAVKEAQSQLKVHETDFGKALLVSPIDGIVLERKIEPGTTVQSNFQVETLFVIAENLDKVKVVVGVSEADIGKVKAGQPATFTVNAYTGKTFETTVTKVEAASKSENNVVTYSTELEMANSDAKFALRSGMTADVLINVGESQPDVFIVPITALSFNPNNGAAAKKDESFVKKIFRPPSRNRGTPVEKTPVLGSIAEPHIWIRQKDKSIKRVPVTLGLDDGKNVEVSGKDLAPNIEILTGNL